ncbi:hypothetical protein DFH08DRAFT_617369, partial [Mycena albidolilacea]
PIKQVKEYKYISIIFTSIMKDIFVSHYSKKVSEACTVANTAFAAKASIGCLLLPDGICLYMARINLHLTFRCEVGIDTS